MNLIEGDNNWNQHLIILLGLVISIAMKVEEAVHLLCHRHKLLYHQRPKTMHLPCHRHPENVHPFQPGRSGYEEHAHLFGFNPSRVEEAKKGNESRKEEQVLLSSKSK